jgi:release factor glutamine methyltransferase
VWSNNQVPLRHALLAAVSRLSAQHVPSPRFTAELLLMFALDCDRAYLYAHPERELTPDEQSRYDQALAERSRGVPAQYITGHQEFWGMDFLITPAVLIPRPETEHLLETVLPMARAFAVPRIVDVGTGSGCIAIALAQELPAAQLDAVDISAEALQLARLNAARHGLEARIRFQQNDLLQGFSEDSFDFVVSNPPYVGESEADTVQLEVRKFEPSQAVFAGPSGIEVIERLLPQAQRVLRPKGRLLMEISGTIVEAARRLLAGWEDVHIVADLQGIPRIASARKR